MNRLVLFLGLAVAAGCGGRGDYRVVTDIGPSIRALDSEDLDEHDAAVARIAALGPDAMPALDRALRTEPPGVRIGVVEAAEQIESAAALRLLMGAAATDESPQVRYEAIRALGLRGDRAAQSVVEAALGATDPTVRLAAAGACPALCRSATALSRLVDLALADQPLANAIAARAAIVRMLADSDEARRTALRAAVASRTPAAMAADFADERRVRAALLDSDLGDPSGLEILAAAARADGAPPLLRLHAVYALGTIGDARAVTPLAALDGDPAVGEYAWDALARLAGRGVAGAAEARQRWRGARPAGALPPPPGMR
jgi:HEAT repeat protein